MSIEPLFYCVARKCQKGLNKFIETDFRYICAMSCKTLHVSGLGTGSRKTAAKTEHLQFQCILVSIEYMIYRDSFQTYIWMQLDMVGEVGNITGYLDNGDDYDEDEADCRPLVQHHLQGLHPRNVPRYLCCFSTQCNQRHCLWRHSTCIFDLQLIFWAFLNNSCHAAWRTITGVNYSLATSLIVENCRPPALVKHLI